MAGGLTAGAGARTMAIRTTAIRTMVTGVMVTTTMVTTTMDMDMDMGMGMGMGMGMDITGGGAERRSHLGAETREDACVAAPQLFSRGLRLQRRRRSLMCLGVQKTTNGTRRRGHARHQH